MIRRRIIRKTAAFGLFPFLAVLICTMGSLIVILVIMVRQAKVQAQAIADAPQLLAEDVVSQEERARLAAQETALSAKLSTLQQTLESNRDELAQRRDALSHVEDHARRLANRVNQLRRDVQRLTDAKNAESTDQQQLQAALARTRQEITAAEAELARARQRLAGREQSYSLIPYDGPNGTPRRPIYIECTADRIVLQPEGIELIPGDFRPPIEASNPLAAALRATREYLSQRDPRLTQQAPYPLLIVRPDGAEMYAEARNAMKSWGSEFGYELVRADLKLAYPAADPALAQVQQRTVNIAREAVNRRALIMGATRRDDTETYLRANGRDGGFVMHRGSGTGSSGGGTGSGGESRRGGGTGGSPGVNPPADSGSPNAAAPNAGYPQTQAAAGPRLELAQNGAGGPDQSGSNQQAQTAVAPGNEVYNGQTQSQNQSQSQSRFSQSDPNGSPSTNPYAPRTQAGSPDQATGEYRPGASTSGSGGSNQGLAESRGQNWALPNYADQSTGFTRPIRIAVYPQQLVVMPEKGTNEAPRVIDVNGPLRTNIDPFIAAVWKHVENWGIAGARAYWKPELQVQVAPGAEARYEELISLLQGSGLTIQRKQP